MPQYITVKVRNISHRNFYTIYNVFKNSVSVTSKHTTISFWYHHLREKKIASVLLLEISLKRFFLRLHSLTMRLFCHPRGIMIPNGQFEKGTSAVRTVAKRSLLISALGEQILMTYSFIPNLLPCWPPYQMKGGRLWLLTGCPVNI